MPCGHTFSSAIAAVFFPVVGLLLLALVTACIVLADKHHKLRVANERNRRLKIQLDAWRDNA